MLSRQVPHLHIFMNRVSAQQHMANDESWLPTRCSLYPQLAWTDIRPLRSRPLPIPGQAVAIISVCVYSSSIL